MKINKIFLNFFVPGSYNETFMNRCFYLFKSKLCVKSSYSVF